MVVQASTEINGSACPAIDYTLCSSSERENEVETADVLTFCPFTPLQSHFPQLEEQP